MVKQQVVVKDQVAKQQVVKQVLRMTKQPKKPTVFGELCKDMDYQMISESPIFRQSFFEMFKALQDLRSRWSFDRFLQRVLADSVTKPAYHLFVPQAADNPKHNDLSKLFD